MAGFFRGLLTLLVVVALLVLVGRIFFFQLGRTESYAMIPNLSAGDYFLIWTRGKIGYGDVAVCRDPENPGAMIVSRVLGLPGTTLSIVDNMPYINGNQIDHQIDDPVTWVDASSPDRLEYAVNIAWEFIGGRLFRTALMTRGKDRKLRETKVESGFFLVSDNRNLARDSRHFGEVPISSCIGRAFLVVWPGPDSGSFKQRHRFFSWID